MGSQLLYSASPEGIASSNEYSKVVLDQPEADLGQVRGLSNSVDTAESHNVRPAVLLGLKGITQNVDAALRRFCYSSQWFHLTQNFLHSTRVLQHTKLEPKNLSSKDEPIPYCLLYKKLHHRAVIDLKILKSKNKGMIFIDLFFTILFMDQISN